MELPPSIELKCVSMEDDGTEIPLPSEINDLDVNNGIFAEEGATVISFVDIDSGEYRRKIDTKTQRIALACIYCHDTGKRFQLLREFYHFKKKTQIFSVYSHYKRH